MSVIVLMEDTDPDPAADLVAAELRRTGTPVFRADPATFPEQLTVAAELSGPEWAGRLGPDEFGTGTGELDLATVTGVYYRRPVGYELDFGRTGGADTRVATQTQLGMSGLLVAIGAWVNAPDRITRAEYAPVQLRTAQQAGLHVPRACVTNDPEAAHRFVDAVGHAVREPFRGRGVGHRADVEDTEVVRTPDDTGHAGGAVRLVRQWIPHDHRARLTVVDDRFFAVSPRTTDAGHHPVTVMPPVRHAVSRFLCCLGLRTATLDFAVDEEDRWWFLRCHPDGRWARVQQETGLPVATALAAALRGPGRVPPVENRS